MQGVPINLEMNFIELSEEEEEMLTDSKSGVTQKETYNAFENKRKQMFLRNAKQVQDYFDSKLKVTELEPHEIWEDIFTHLCRHAKTSMSGNQRPSTDF